MRVINDGGGALDAEFSLGLDGDVLTLTMESASGRSGTRPPKNSQYMHALDLLLARLQKLDAVLLDGYVDSRESRRRQLTKEECRIVADDAGPLREVRDITSLRRRLTAKAGGVGRLQREDGKPGKEGNRSKRIKLIFTVPQQSAAFDRLLRALVSGELELSEGITADRRQGHHASVSNHDQEQRQANERRARDAGYIADAEVRRAIEQQAVRQAVDLYHQEGYEVDDVGLIKPYDLHATRGDEVVHVEVKGSSQTADSVELTINEVEHAYAAVTDLVVVDAIAYTRLDDGTVQTRDGRVRRWSSWSPAEADLSATRFRYCLPGDASGVGRTGEM
ncbi:protein NO VEIN domain-containing protein [Nonomuraea indica]|uniref:Protein NO VEIN domain-containing protein n=1 Tax=Nonomuraea indica TaxID=1581193 RepID=A0ABW8A1B4_9ACTN